MTGTEYNKVIATLLQAADDLMGELEAVATERAVAVSRGIESLQLSIGELPIMLDEEEVSESDVFALEVAQEGMAQYASSTADIVDAYNFGKGDGSGASGCAPIIALGIFGLAFPFLALAAHAFLS